MRKALLIALAANVLLFAFTVLLGCASTAHKKDITEVKMAVKMPLLAPLRETNPLQEKGGISISLSPILYQVIQDSVVKDVTVNPSFLEALTAKDGAVFFDRTVTPVLGVTPDELRFVIKLNNKLNHVIRGAGTVVSFVINGNQIALSQEHYSELLNAIVVPRGEAQLGISGPKLNAIPDSCTIGLFLYDFVTATDAAGNPTEKQNFEWYYTYKAQTHEQMGSVKKTRMVRQ